MTTDLRRADWRFLLPPPSQARFEHLVVLGGPAQLRTRLEEIGIARKISGTIPPDDGQADAVVVLHDAARDLAKAVKAVARGGAFHVEVDRRSAAGLMLTPARVARHLRTAGVTPSAVHWVVPSFDGAKRYLPLDGSGAIDWYLDTTQRRFSLIRTVAVSMLRALARRDSRRLAPLAPCFTVTGVRSPTAAVMPAVLTQPEVASRLTGSPRSVALATSGRSEASRVVLVPFGEAGVAGRLIKLSRVPAFNERTIREQATLHTLHTRADPGLSETVPTPYWCGQWNDLTVAIESYAPGPTLLASSSGWTASSRRRLEDFARATAWLTAFHRQWTLSADSWTAAERERWVNEPIGEYTDVFGASPAERRLFDSMMERADALHGRCLPVVLQHRDFGPWNVHDRDGHLIVIDWEFDGTNPLDRAGPALMDLVYFATYWTFAARRLARAPQQLEAFRALFVARRAEHPFVRAAREGFSAYMAALGIDAGFLPLIVALTWLHHAVAQERRATRALDGFGYNPYLPYVRSLAEHAAECFHAAAA